jgi:ADP-heptose:LPS heptosyltransferase
MGALGDLLLLRPTLASLRAASHHVTLLAPGNAASVLAREVEVVPSDSPAAAALWTPGATLPPTVAGHDAALAYSRAPELLAQLRDLPRLVVRDPQPPAGAGHAAEWLAGALGELGVPSLREAPKLEPTGAESRTAEALAPAPFVVLHPGSGSARKNWPAERFADLAERVAPGLDRVVVEGPADAGAAERLARGLPGARRVRTPEPGVLGALCARAELYVGNDSGVSHLAAAFGGRCLVLFGPTDASVWRPLGPHVRVAVSPTPDMNGLDVATAAAAL